MVQVAIIAAVVFDEPTEGLYLPVLHEGKLGRVDDVACDGLQFFRVEAVPADDGCKVLSESRLAVRLALVWRDGEDAVVHEPCPGFLVVERVAVGEAHLAVGSPPKVDDAVLILLHLLQPLVEILKVKALVVVVLADESAPVVVALICHL